MSQRRLQNEDDRIARKRGPSPAKTAATRRLLVEAALTEFLDKGFDATRMSDVAARAGLAKGTAYLYFADKETLFVDVLRDVMRAALGSPLERPRPDEPIRVFLLRIVPPMLRQLQASGRLRILFLVMSEGQRFPAVAAAYHAVAITPTLRLIRIFAQRAQRRGELRSDALARHPILMAAPVVVSTFWNILFARDGTLDVAEVFTAYLDLVFAPEHASHAVPGELDVEA